MKYMFDSNALDKSYNDVVTEVLGDNDEYDVNAQDNDACELDPQVLPYTDPVDVRIVTDGPTFVIDRAAMAWQGQKTIVLGVNVAGYQQAQLIVGANPRRRYVQISNLGNKNIALGPTSSVKFGNATNGVLGNYELIPNGFGGGLIIIPTTAEVWALADPTSAAGEAVNILEVFDGGQF